MYRRFSTQVVVWLLLTFDASGGLCQSRTTVRTQPARSKVGADPFAEIRRLAAGRDLTDVAVLWSLVHAAHDRTLYGTSRRFARRVLQCEPNHSGALRYLGEVLVCEGAKTQWLNPDEQRMHAAGCFRDTKYGWIAEADRPHLAAGLLRASDGSFKSAAELDALHSTWSLRRTIRARFFDVCGCVPLEAMWYVADELDALTIAYCDFFETSRLPRKRFTVHLYRQAEDADAAGADGALLKRYGAYFQGETLHVMFTSIGGLTAVRHEAAHALNRVFIKRLPLPQWIDEGIGVYCQFAHVGGDQSIEFGRFPRHAFGLKFVEEVQQGREETLISIAATGHVTTNSHYYSKFRAMVDFFLSGDGGKHRFRFIEAVFRGRGKMEDLLTPGPVNEAWLSYVKNLRPSDEWQYLRDPKRAASVQLLLRKPADSALNSR